jgi:hypothetical protein
MSRHPKPPKEKTRPVLLDLPVSYTDKLQKAAFKDRRSMKAQAEKIVMDALDALNGAAQHAARAGA